MSAEGNGTLRRWSYRGTVAGASVILLGFLWPRIVGIVRAVDNLAWLETHRAEYPTVMSGYVHFQEKMQGSLEAATADRADIRKLVNQVAHNQSEMQGSINVMSEMLYEVLKLKRIEMGLPVPPKPPKLGAGAITRPKEVPAPGEGG